MNLLDYSPRENNLISITVASDTDGNNSCLNIQSNKNKNSYENVDWVNQKIGSGRTSYSSTKTGFNSDIIPHKLIFALEFSAIFKNKKTGLTYYCPHILLGKSKTSLDQYSWWFFSFFNNPHSPIMKCYSYKLKRDRLKHTKFIGISGQHIPENMFELDENPMIFDRDMYVGYIN